MSVVVETGSTCFNNIRLISNCLSDKHPIPWWKMYRRYGKFWGIFPDAAARVSLRKENVHYPIKGDAAKFR